MNELLTQAATRLLSGGLVSFPTETVYGLGANARDGKAVAAIYALKGRPQFNPLIVHFAQAADAQKETEWNARAEKLAPLFWPGPLTLVLPRKRDSSLSLLVSAGLDTLAVRVPAHPLAQSLLEKAGIPVAAPSANRSGRVSPTRASHVRAEFGDDVLVLDGGDCAVGLESTVLDLTGSPRILRPGSVTREMLEESLDESVAVAEPGAAIAAPGMLKSHYAPSLPVRLNAREARSGEALLAFGPHAGTLNLSESGDLAEAASRLFACLRELDKPEFSGIAVMEIPSGGLGEAINDRLKRAAARDK